MDTCLPQRTPKSWPNTGKRCDGSHLIAGMAGGWRDEPSRPKHGKKSANPRTRFAPTPPSAPLDLSAQSRPGQVAGCRVARRSRRRERRLLVKPVSVTRSDMATGLRRSERSVGSPTEQGGMEFPENLRERSTTGTIATPNGARRCLNETATPVSGAVKKEVFSMPIMSCAGLRIPTIDTRSTTVEPSARGATENNTARTDTDCVERAEAFFLAGVPDPTVYADSEFWRSECGVA